MRNLIECDNSESPTQLGRALQAWQTGRPEFALELLGEFLREAPDRALALNLRGIVHLTLHRTREALADMDAAAAVCPPTDRELLAAIQANRANALRDLGEHERAVEASQSALGLTPDSAAAYVGLGAALADLGRAEGAVRAYERAIELQPALAAAHYNLGCALEQLDETQRVRAAYSRSIELNPAMEIRRLRQLTICPLVFHSNAEIDEYRERLRSEIDSLRQEWSSRATKIELSRAATVLSAPPFPLMYQGRDDRPLKEAYADLCRGLLPQTAAELPSPSGGKPRIGFLATRQHVAALTRCLGELIERLDRRRFDVRVFVPNEELDFATRQLRLETGELISLERGIDQIAATVRAARCDLLYHWEVGSDVTNFLLPFLRLAPRQVTSWGVQVTSGIAELDFYLSSRLLEPESGPSHYTESLLLLNDLPSFYRRPRCAPPASTREEFGLREREHVYFCGQVVGKLQPDFDLLLRAILERDERGVVVLLAERVDAITQRLRRRLEHSLGIVAERVRILPRLPHPRYLSLLEQSDVVLDTPHYNGVTTTHDAFYLGKPVVTLEGGFQRSRYVAACYRVMERPELVTKTPDEYAALAVDLGCEPDRRRELARHLTHTCEVLWDPATKIRDHEERFLEMVAAR